MAPQPGSLLRLSPLDSIYADADSVTTPMHAAELQVYILPEQMSALAWVTAVRDRLVRISARMPFMNHRLHRDPLNVGMPLWVSAFVDVEYHIRVIQLDSPGDRQTLANCCARLHEERLDPARPLWQHTLLHGLDGNRVAVYFKGHHAYGDAQMQQAFHALLMDGGPDPESLPPVPWRNPPPIGQRLGDTLQRNLAGWRSLFEQSPAALTRSAFQIRPLPVQPAAFNRRIDHKRQLLLLDFPLLPLLAIAKQEDCKFNDVFLAMISKALAALDPVPLVALCSIALPVEQALGDAGNRTASMQIDLATGLASAHERLRQIANNTMSAKDTLAKRAANPDHVLEIPGGSAALRVALRLVEGGAEATGLAGQLRWPFHLVVSNVRGPTTRQSLIGATLDHSWFVSMLYHGLGLAVACFSVGQCLNISIVMCPSATPKRAQLRDAFHAAYAELVQLVDVNRAPMP